MPRTPWPWLLLILSLAGLAEAAPATQAAGLFAVRAELAVSFGSLVFAGGPHDDSGPAIGIEGRLPLASGWTIGGSINGGANLGILTDELSLTSCEVNVVRVLPLSPKVRWGVGGGLALVHGRYEDVDLFEDREETVGWVPAAQLGAELDWYPGRFVVGVRGSRQFTGDFEDFGWSLDHWRLVCRTGVTF